VKRKLLTEAQGCGKIPSSFSETEERRLMSNDKKVETISGRIEKCVTAFRNGQLDDHQAVNTFTNEDATGQRGWGPLMQT
jgi:hypothetical protein